MIKEDRAVDQLPDELSTLRERVDELEKSAIIRESIFERYRIVFEESSDGFAMIDTEGRLQEYNPAFRNMVGYTDQELCEMTYRDLTPEKWHQAEEEIIRGQMIVRGYADCYEKEYRRKDGTIIPVELRTHLVRNTQGEPVGMWAFVRDITERKKKEKALRERKEVFRLLFEKSGDAHLLIEDGRFIGCNEAALEMAGGVHTSQLFHFTPGEISPERQPDGLLSTEKAKKMFEIAYRDGRNRFEWVHKKFDGTDVCIDVMLTPICWKGKTLLYTTWRDLTEIKKKEEELAWKTAFLEAQMDATIDGILVVDGSSKVIFMNSHFIEIWKFPRRPGKEETNTTLLQHAMDRTRDPKRFIERVRYLYDHPDETSRDEIELKDGRVLDQYSSPVVGKDGKYYGRIWTFRNITKRRIAENELRESQKRLSDIIAFLPDATLVINKDGKVIAWNRAMEAITGVREEEMLGKGDKAYAIPFYGERRPILIDLVMQPDREVEATYTAIKRQDDAIFGEAFTPQLPPGNIHLSGTASVFRDSQGKIIAAIECLRDDTERKHMEAELAAEHDRLAAVLNGIPIAAFMIDNDCRVLLWNRYIEISTGKTKEAVLGKELDLGFLFQGKVSPTLAEILLQMSDDEILERFGTRGVRKYDHFPSAFESTGKIHLGGEQRTFTARATRIYDSRGKIIGAIQTSQDITEQLQAEEEKQQMQAQIFSVQKMEAIGILAGGIAHDFNNVLASIIGYTEMALYTSQETRTKEYLDHVIEASDRAKKLINQILAFSHDREQEKKPVNISLIVKEALRLLRSALPTTIEIRQHISSEYATVLSDPTKVHQIAMNLCTNAAHAMYEKGGILDVTISDIDIVPSMHPRSPDFKAGAYVLLAISDNGRGIDPAIIDKIYDPFFTTKKPGEGTGLGLSVVYGIVKSYGGVITVQSQVGKGTTFNVYFPRIPDAVIAQEKTADATIPAGHEQILCIDDEESIITLIHEFLESIGYKVVSTTSCLEALSIYEEEPHRFDLVITDLTMPQMTGLDLARKILSGRPELPVLLCTGYNETFTLESIRKRGLKDLIVKPISLKNLALRVRRALDG